MLPYGWPSGARSLDTVSDGQLITGQNPASSGPAAKLLFETVSKPAAAR